LLGVVWRELGAAVAVAVPMATDGGAPTGGVEADGAAFRRRGEAAGQQGASVWDIEARG
jgi:hypothetical protein